MNSNWDPIAIHQKKGRGVRISWAIEQCFMSKSYTKACLSAEDKFLIDVLFKQNISVNNICSKLQFVPNSTKDTEARRFIELTMKEKWMVKKRSKIREERN